MNIVQIKQLQFWPHHQSSGSLSEADACPSVCPMPLAQKWYVLELQLLTNTNGKPHTGNQCGYVAVRNGQNVLEDKKTHVVSIAKVEPDRPVVTTKRE